jgi:hypothetical protein
MDKKSMGFEADIKAARSGTWASFSPMSSSTTC